MFACIKPVDDIEQSFAAELFMSHKVHERPVMPIARFGVWQVFVHIIITLNPGRLPNQRTVVVLGTECYAGHVVVALKVSHVD